MDNCVAFVNVIGGLVWMGAGVCIMVGFLDANGNQTQSTGNNARIIEYTPFNKTKKLTDGFTKRGGGLS
jgi:hypothetical protein